MSASVFWHSYLFNVPLFIAILAILPWRIPWRAPHPWLWACYIAVVQSVKLYLQLDSVLHDTTASLIMWGLPQQIFNILMMSFCIGISLPEACLFFSLLFLFVDRHRTSPFLCRISNRNQRTAAVSGHHSGMGHLSLLPDHRDFFADPYLFHASVLA